MSHPAPHRPGLSRDASAHIGVATAHPRVYTVEPTTVVPTLAWARAVAAGVAAEHLDLLPPLRARLVEWLYAVPASDVLTFLRDQTVPSAVHRELLRRAPAGYFADADALSAAIAADWWTTHHREDYDCAAHPDVVLEAALKRLQRKRERPDVCVLKDGLVALRTVQTPTPRLTATIRALVPSLIAALRECVQGRGASDAYQRALIELTCAVPGLTSDQQRTVLAALPPVLEQLELPDTDVAALLAPLFEERAAARADAHTADAQSQESTMTYVLAAAAADEGLLGAALCMIPALRRSRAARQAFAPFVRLHHLLPHAATDRAGFEQRWVALCAAHPIHAAALARDDHQLLPYLGPEDLAPLLASTIDEVRVVAMRALAVVSSVDGTGIDVRNQDATPTLRHRV